MPLEVPSRELSNSVLSLQPEPDIPPELPPPRMRCCWESQHLPLYNPTRAVTAFDHHTWRETPAHMERERDLTLREKMKAKHVINLCTWQTVDWHTYRILYSGLDASMECRIITCTHLFMMPHTCTTSFLGSTGVHLSDTCLSLSDTAAVMSHKHKCVFIGWWILHPFHLIKISSLIPDR